MGRGDKRSRKGKIFSGSYGNSRPHSVRTFVGKPVGAVKAAAVAEKPAKLSTKKKASA